jgi:hypothetical protein
MKNPEIGHLFATMVEHGGQLASSLPSTQQAAVHAMIADAFRAAFLSIAAFTTLGCVLALTIPLRRV